MAKKTTTNSQAVTAQCVRCGDNAPRVVDANDGGERSTMTTLDTCPRCGHDEVLSHTIADVQS